MGSPQVLFWIIAGCAVFVLILFFYKVLFKLLKIFAKAAAAGFCIMLANSLIGFVGLGLTVGINAFTIIFTAIFGIPGFITLYVTQFALR
ncbi:MAG: pro-sigmaK processing inhibitor BofA family protein [Clostridiales bacterium]|nr:pro-sigmaK processing inhibitor BofA family protein [Clostridiales bacterium]